MTMKIKHHLTDELLMAYAAGSLPEAFSLVVATHVSMCDECRARLAEYEAVGGAVLEDTGTPEMDAGSLEATLRLIGEMREAEEAETAAPAPQASGLFPQPLRDYVGGDLDAVEWRSVGGKVRQAVLPTDKGAAARLLYIPAGAAMPDHGHSGMELTMVLQGAFEDADGYFGRGDVEVAGEEMEHTPVAAPGADCVCLVATDAPLKFSGFLPRMAQPFIGI
ncbi:ChrR family anti-sigma-E factor [Rhodovulum adriaticum]|uniref:ChrR-like anti-ECFsigma factor n=1 Tax=Rhodovulum adriaticum TaxID=35804 RepID=A0A4R2NY09_RHOAD|nr:ChrR family anti-sigma-E factor [Rhodovulum adriaticum]MBK1634314.1 transcriptional regulator [Rhodovulum adriaticum]TCP27133.1 ChrR-like anti-ECFsigma factor [Rhodovulum adriaticum]